MPRAGAVFIVLALTALSFVGGLAWLLAHWARPGRRLIWFLALYTGLSAALWHGSVALHRAGIAPDYLRVPVNADGAGNLISQSWIYTALNRAYVSPEMSGVASDLAAHMARAYPGTVTVTLDGNFPFGDGLPLLPHLSHDDGGKLDFALYWQDGSGVYVPGFSKSPIGYWGYAQGGSNCPGRWADLRWDFSWAQPLLPAARLDAPRTRAALLWLADDPRVAKILIEPHIKTTLRLGHPKIRFQGCRAARHDDHIHIQL